LTFRTPSQLDDVLLLVKVELVEAPQQANGEEARILRTWSK